MTLRDGRVISHTVEDMRVTRGNPMTRADFIKKFTSSTHDLLPKDVLDQIIGELLDVEKHSDMRQIFERIARHLIIP